jgi:eukaryotic-like serine/threonine-protein kinase
MPLTPGTRVGPYEITAPLGKGGMGEVYRATDLKLKRDVALKVLPALLSDDPTRMARFQREAEVLASLNHSNIAQIYGLEEQNGTRAIVMELVEGETLADIIKRGPIPVETAIAYSKQIASALEYAHDKQRPVIHRDLKPANIQVTPEGTVKVLDFGLAKALADEPAAPSADLTNSPTLTMGPTVVGMILGTAAYMSPEQAKGKTLDRRSDIWSFGVVLYEMVTGQRLFTGEEVGDILAAIVLQEPKLDAVPARLRPAIERCLRKDPRKRWYSMEDVRFALDEPAPTESAVEHLPAPSRSRFGVAWALATGLLLVLLLGLAFVHFRETQPESPTLNASLLPPDGANFDFATYALPAISPDGKRIVFGARPTGGKQQLYLRRLDSPTAQPLPGTEDAYGPFWSPDSRYVAFAQGASLKKIDIQGGPPVTIAPATNVRGGTWNAQGVILFGSNAGGPLFRVASAGGTPVPATTVDKGDTSGNRYPYFLPDQKHFLYTAPHAETPFPLRVGSLDEPGKPGKIVAQVASNAMFAAGQLFYLRESTLMAQPFDSARLETTGEAIPVAEQVPTFGLPSRMAAYDVSATGLLVYQSGGAGGQSQLTWLDRNGKVLQQIGDPAGFQGLHLSPDGKTLAAAIDASDVWLYELARALKTRLTFDAATDTDPVWTPDGATIIWRSLRKSGGGDLFRNASNGTGTEELLYSDAATKRPMSVSPDGKALLYHGPDPNNPKTSNDIWVLPLMPDQPGAPLKPHALLQTQFSETYPQFSPDGTWVAYGSNESGQSEVYAMPYPGPGGKRQISTGGGFTPLWRSNGQEIYYVSSAGDLMAAEVAVRNRSLEVGKVRKLFGGVPTISGYPYAPAADGQKFIVAQNSATAVSRPLTLIQNWPALLKK